MSQPSRATTSSASSSPTKNGESASTSRARVMQTARRSVSSMAPRFPQRPSPLESTKLSSAVASTATSTSPAVTPSSTASTKSRKYPAKFYATPDTAKPKDDVNKPDPKDPTPWNHPDELKYIRREDWSQDLMLEYLSQKSFSIPPQAPSSSVPLCQVTQRDGTAVMLPRGYRIPLMYLAKFQWESLYLVLTAGDPDKEWEEFKFDIIHISRLCQHLFQQARDAAASDKGIDRTWRSKMFDRVLTRFYRKWFISREWSLQKFYEEYDYDEYFFDVLKYDWNRWAQRGNKGFKLTKAEIQDGITADQYMRGLQRGSDGVWSYNESSQLTTPFDTSLEVKRELMDANRSSNALNTTSTEATSAPTPASASTVLPKPAGTSPTVDSTGTKSVGSVPVSPIRPEELAGITNASDLDPAPGSPSRREKKRRLSPSNAEREAKRPRKRGSYKPPTPRTGDTARPSEDQSASESRPANDSNEPSSNGNSMHLDSNRGPPIGPAPGSEISMHSAEGETTTSRSNVPEPVPMDVDTPNAESNHESSDTPALAPIITTPTAVTPSPAISLPKVPDIVTTNGINNNDSTNASNSIATPTSAAPPKSVHLPPALRALSDIPIPQGQDAVVTARVASPLPPPNEEVLKTIEALTEKEKRMLVAALRLACVPGAATAPPAAVAVDTNLGGVNNLIPNGAPSAIVPSDGTSASSEVAPVAVPAPAPMQISEPTDSTTPTSAPISTSKTPSDVQLALSWSDLQSHEGGTSFLNAAAAASASTTTTAAPSASGSATATAVDPQSPPMLSSFLHAREAPNPNWEPYSTKPITTPSTVNVLNPTPSPSPSLASLLGKDTPGSAVVSRANSTQLKDDFPRLSASGSDPAIAPSLGDEDRSEVEGLFSLEDSQTLQMNGASGTDAQGGGLRETTPESIRSTHLPPCPLNEPGTLSESTDSQMVDHSTVLQSNNVEAEQTRLEAQPNGVVDDEAEGNIPSSKSTFTPPTENICSSAPPAAEQPNTTPTTTDGDDKIAVDDETAAVTDDAHDMPLDPSLGPLEYMPTATRTKSLNTILLLLDLLQFLIEPNVLIARWREYSFSKHQEQLANLNVEERLEVLVQASVALAKVLFPYKGGDLSTRIGLMDQRLKQQFEMLLKRSDEVVGDPPDERHENDVDIDIEMQGQVLRQEEGGKRDAASVENVKQMSEKSVQTQCLALEEDLGNKSVVPDSGDIPDEPQAPKVLFTENMTKGKQREMDVDMDERRLSVDSPIVDALLVEFRAMKAEMTVNQKTKEEYENAASRHRDEIEALKAELRMEQRKREEVENAERMQKDEVERLRNELQELSMFTERESDGRRGSIESGRGREKRDRTDDGMYLDEEFSIKGLELVDLRRRIAILEALAERSVEPGEKNKEPPSPVFSAPLSETASQHPLLKDKSHPTHPLAHLLGRDIDGAFIDPYSEPATPGTSSSPVDSRSLNFGRDSMTPSNARATSPSQMRHPDGMELDENVPLKTQRKFQLLHFRPNMR